MIFNQPKAAAGVSKDTRMSTAKEMTDEQFEDIVLTAMRSTMNSTAIKALTATIWKDGIDIERATISATDFAKEILKQAALRTLPSSDQCVAREAVLIECAEIATRFDDCGGAFIAEKIRDLALAVPQAAVAVQDQWFVDRSLPIMAMSGDIESDRVLKLHFRRKVTDKDRADLVDVLNAGEQALSSRPDTMTDQRLLEDMTLADNARRVAIRECAKIAENGCLVPPDGGSPTAEEKEMCDGIAKAILALTNPAPTELEGK